MTYGSVKGGFPSYDIRKYRNLNKIKNLDRKKLLEGLEDGFEFVTEPYLHQLACFRLGVERDNLLLFLDMGLGKTKIVCDIYRYRRMRSGVERALVVVPFSVLRNVWIDEVNKHCGGECTVVTCGGYGETRLQDVLNGRVSADFVVTTSQHLLRVSGAFGRRKRVSVSFFDELASMFDMLIVDEIDAYKNPSAKSTRILIELGKRIRYRYGMTGTPMNRTPHDLWSQYTIVAGCTLFGSLSDFRRYFFVPVVNHWGGVDWKFRKERKSMLDTMMWNDAVRYRVGECYDLPHAVRQTITVRSTSDIDEEVERIVRTVRESNRNYRTLKNALIAMRQLSSGIVTFLNEKNKELRIVRRLDENPKLDALRELIVRLPNDSKVVIFHEYLESYRILRSLLEALRIDFVYFNSETRDRGKFLKDFVEGDARVALANYVSAGSGLNLQVANYVFFYETPMAPRQRLQAEARCIRHGQKNTVFVYDFAVEGTLDRAILQSLKKGVDFFDSVVNGDRTFLELLKR